MSDSMSTTNENTSKQSTACMPIDTRKQSTKRLVTSGLLVALLVVSCFFIIPLGPVPFTLQTAVIILIALLLPPKQAAITCAIYLFMGAIGLPVFSGMTGGFGKFLGPTGGFLISYPIATACASFARCMLERRKVPQIACDVVVCVLIIIIADMLGCTWFMIVTNSDLAAALTASVAPFVFVDCCKGALAIAIACAVRKAIDKKC